MEVKDYFGLDLDTIWLTVKRDLPVLLRKIDRIK